MGRLHAVWIIAHSDTASAVDDLFEIAESDPDPVVSAQAVRAIGDLTDPVLVHHRIAAGRGDNEIAMRLARMSEKADPRRQARNVDCLSQASLVSGTRLGQ